MKKVALMTLPELAAFVSSQLRNQGIQAVLSGGACVSVYTENKFQSYDLDFIENLATSPKRLREVMAGIGFLPKNRYFVHPETEYFVEFPAGPLTAGDEPLSEVIELSFPTGILTLLSPTSCVKDRLAAYYHWQDRQSLAQAEMVAWYQEIDLSEIRRWSIHEGKENEFQAIAPIFQAQIDLKKTKKP